MFDQFKIFMKALQAESRLRVAINSLYTGVFGENGLSETELSTLNGSKWDVLQIIEIKEALNSVEGFMMPSLAYYEEVGKHHGVKDTLYMPVPVYCQECGENIYRFAWCALSAEGKHTIKERGDVRNINDDIIEAHKEAEENRVRLNWLMTVRDLLSIRETGRFLSEENEKLHLDDLIQQYYIRPVYGAPHEYRLTKEGVSAIKDYIPSADYFKLMDVFDDAGHDLKPNAKDVDLESLVGEHELTGVDFLDDGGEFDPATIFNFTLDGITYTATEDPDDGYRSMLKSLTVSARSTANTFPPCKVTGWMREGGLDILDLIDVKTDKIVISVGTDTSDDYYPTFVAHFDPAAMAINAGSKDA